MRTRPLGSMIGATGGPVFVLVNAGPVPASLIWRSAATVAFVATIWLVVIRRPAVRHAPPSRAALRTYALSVAAMVVAIPAGAAVITQVLDRPEAVLVWVVFVVGAHFLPFAHAFGLPAFRWLAGSLVVVAAAGAIPTLATGSSVASAWTGVVAGFVLLAFSAAGPWLAREATAQLSSSN